MDTSMPADQESLRPTAEVFAVKYANGPICIETHAVDLAWKPGTARNHLPGMVSDWIAAGTLSSVRLMVGLCVRPRACV